MVVGATISINNSRVSGDIDGGRSEDTALLEKILAAIKEGNKQKFVAGRKEESSSMLDKVITGFIAKKGLSMLLPLAKGGVGIAALLAALVSMPGQGGNPSNEALAIWRRDYQQGFSSGTIAREEGSRYAKGQLESGEDVVFEIDNVTGETLRTLTEQQAIQEGILDKYKNIVENAASQELIGMSLLAESKLSGDQYVVMNSTLAEIQLQQDGIFLNMINAGTYSSLYTKALKKLAEDAAKKANLADIDKAVEGVPIRQGGPRAGPVGGPTMGNALSGAVGGSLISNLPSSKTDEIETRIIYDNDRSAISKYLFSFGRL